MAPLTQPNGPATTQDTDELFLELLCADEDLVRAEFDAIIAAEWFSPAPPASGSDEVAEATPHQVWRRRRVRDVGLADRPRRPGIGGRGRRQRSPPPARYTSQDRKHVQTGRE
jgi:hypothetical protein